MEKVYDSLNEAKDICLEKMQRTSDAEEFKNYADSLVRVSNALNEVEKAEKEQDLEIKKYEESTKLVDKKALITLAAGTSATIVVELIRYFLLTKHTERICNFEATNIFGSSAGKGLLGSLRIRPFDSRGDR